MQQASHYDAESQCLALQVGALSGGLAGALWSPDGNLLCLVSLQGQLLLMNKVGTPDAPVSMARTLLWSNSIIVQRQGGRVLDAMDPHAVALCNSKGVHQILVLLLPDSSERRL